MIANKTKGRMRAGQRRIRMADQAFRARSPQGVTGTASKRHQTARHLVAAGSGWSPRGRWLSGPLGGGVGPSLEEPSRSGRGGEKVSVPAPTGLWKESPIAF